jgi:RimJ/RimL family protein N-acetyltransferase
MREAADGPLVGIVDAKMRARPPGADQGDPAVELSWTTVPAARGRGIATTAVRAMVAFIGTLGREQVWAKVKRDNAASIAVARAAGLRKVSGDERWVFLSGPTGAG